MKVTLINDTNTGTTTTDYAGWNYYLEGQWLRLTKNRQLLLIPVHRVVRIETTQP
jgi:uncharacterized protein (UPF0248 family)